MADSELRGAALLATAVNHILAHPETWYQQEWHCGTTHCIAGQCELIATGTTTRDTRDIVRVLLRISELEADWLFAWDRTLPEIYRFAQVMLDSGRDRDGRDRDGRDREGYDRLGYDRLGYDREGRDRWGYDRWGYDRAGYDRAGYDREGNLLPPLVIPATE